ncbi:NuA4 histone acetyltransferase subunit [Trebouxia sp. C0009 RCD-2024]
MYGGDEVNAVVVDVGSHTVKAGFAGEDTPKALFPAAVGLVPEDKAGGAKPMDTDADGPNKRRRITNRVYVGSSDLSYRREHMEVEDAMQKGLYRDMDVIQELWDHAFKQRLVIDPKEHPILFAEPTFNTKALREQMVQTAFEQYGSPAIFLAKNAVLSSFATGRQTSLVVDAGHEGTVGESQL